MRKYPQFSTLWVALVCDLITSRGYKPAQYYSIYINHIASWEGKSCHTSPKIPTEMVLWPWTFGKVAEEQTLVVGTFWWVHSFDCYNYYKNSSYTTYMHTSRDTRSAQWSLWCNIHSYIQEYLGLHCRWLLTTGPSTQYFYLEVSQTADPSLQGYWHCSDPTSQGARYLIR